MKTAVVYYSRHRGISRPEPPGNHAPKHNGRAARRKPQTRRRG